MPGFAAPGAGTLEQVKCNKKEVSDGLPGLEV